MDFHTLKRLAGSSAVVLLITIAFPFAYRAWALGATDRDGRRRAEADWANQAAMIYYDGMANYSQLGDDVTISREFDLATGLQLYRNFHHGFEEGYNQRVAALLKQHGIPSWSAKLDLPSDDAMASILNSGEFQRITTFPYDVNESITIMYGGTLARWGGYMSGGNSPSVATKYGSWGAGGWWPVELGQFERYPKLIFVRVERAMLVFLLDGRCVATVSRLR